MGHGLASALSFSASLSPLCLRLFFNLLTHSVFLHLVLNVCHVSCSALSNSGIVLPLFNYSRLLVTFWHTWKVSCTVAIHTNSSLNGLYFIYLCYLLPAPLLTPLFFHHPFHASHFTRQAKLADTKTIILMAVCEALNPEWSLSLHAQRQCLVMGTGWDPSLTSSPDI